MAQLNITTTEVTIVDVGELLEPNNFTKTVTLTIPNQNKGFIIRSIGAVFHMGTDGLKTPTGALLVLDSFAPNTAHNSVGVLAGAAHHIIAVLPLVEDCWLYDSTGSAVCVLLLTPIMVDVDVIKVMFRLTSSDPLGGGTGEILHLVFRCELL